MPTDYEIELGDPETFRCADCGGLTVRLTRFVKKAGDAFAVYYAEYTNGHPEAAVHLLISLGAWGEGSDPTERVAFSCRVTLKDGQYASTLGDAADSPWGEVEVLGASLSRAQALEHPWKGMAFEVLDAAFAQDRSLQRFFERVGCGDAAVPLEWGYGLPDALFPLRDDPGGRVRRLGALAILDDARFFVRCLLPVPVEGYGAWRVGLWVEVTRPDFERVGDAWDDAARYPALRFTGRLANDVATDVGLPVPARAEVFLHVPNPEALPEIDPEATAALAGLFARPWARADFEAYAVARAFL